MYLIWASSFKKIGSSFLRETLKTGLLFNHSVVPDSFTAPWTVTRQAPVSTGFPRQECQSGWPFLPPGDIPDPGIKPTSPALAGRFFTTEQLGKPKKAGLLDP